VINHELLTFFLLLQGDGENDDEEDSRNVDQGGTAENGNVSVVSEEDSRVEAETPVTHSSSQPNRENQNETRTLPLLLSPRWWTYISTRRHNSAIMYISLVLLLQSQKNKTSFFRGHSGFLV